MFTTSWFIHQVCCSCTLLYFVFSDTPTVPAQQSTKTFMWYFRFLYFFLLVSLFVILHAQVENAQQTCKHFLTYKFAFQRQNWHHRHFNIVSIRNIKNKKLDRQSKNNLRAQRFVDLTWIVYLLCILVCLLCVFVCFGYFYPGKSDSRDFLLDHQRSELMNPAGRTAETSFPLSNSVCTDSCSCLFVVIESVSAFTAFIAVFTNINISDQWLGSSHHC